jgi:hypothetical protein
MAIAPMDIPVTDQLLMVVPWLDPLVDSVGYDVRLSYTVGTANSFMRSLNRCVLFGVSRPTEGGLAVRRRVPQVATRHLMRMPAHLRQAHQLWSVPTTRISLDDLERARVLAEAMVETGDDPDAVERQLLALGVTPSAAIEATTMAISGGYPPDAA